MGLPGLPNGANNLNPWADGGGVLDLPTRTPSGAWDIGVKSVDLAGGVGVNSPERTSPRTHVFQIMTSRRINAPSETFVKKDDRSDQASSTSGKSNITPAVPA